MSVALNLHDSSRCNPILLFLSARVTPFSLSVFTDDLEAHGADGAAMEALNEASGVVIAGAMGASPLGTSGFSLGFAQIAC